jgi:P27 family predicted phage terminase small subunit
MRLLTSLDVHTLATYCVAYSRWRTAEELLAELRAEDPSTRGLLVDGRINPLVKISRYMAQDMLRYAGEFGFTPATRYRISLGIGPAPDDKFGGLIAGWDGGRAG